MKTISITHDEIAQRAQKIWQDSGWPTGRDTEFWLEAERQLAAGSRDTDVMTHEPALPFSKSNGAAAQTARLRGEMASESVVEFQITPAIPEEEAIRAALQKHDARAPILPHKFAPKAAPPESGKPLWNQPHSS